MIRNNRIGMGVYFFSLSHDKEHMLKMLPFYSFLFYVFTVFITLIFLSFNRGLTFDIHCVFILFLIVFLHGLEPSNRLKSSYHKHDSCYICATFNMPILIMYYSSYFFINLCNWLVWGEKIQIELFCTSLNGQITMMLNSNLYNWMAITGCHGNKTNMATNSWIYEARKTFISHFSWTLPTATILSQIYFHI
jgi:hypothetical protein